MSGVEMVLLVGTIIAVLLLLRANHRRRKRRREANKSRKRLGQRIRRKMHGKWRWWRHAIKRSRGLK
jgi:hypothetical protein